MIVDRAATGLWIRHPLGLRSDVIGDIGRMTDQERIQLSR
jgi:hypothetical protein